MKLLDLLFESLTDTVYHFTYTPNLVKILKTNEINLSNSLGSNADFRNRGKFNFLSLTRSKMSGFKKGTVKIVFDGRKLNQKYKSIPIDYWEYPKNEKDWESKSRYIDSLKSLEQEDRIISNDTEIPNVSKYIKEIHIWDRYDNSTAIALKYAKQRNIPVYIYDNEKDFYKQTNPIQNLDYLENPEDENEDDNYEKKLDYDLASFIAYKNLDAHQKIIEYLNDEEKINKFEKVLKERTIYNYKINSPYKEDGLNYISAIIHNSRTNRDKDDVFLLNLLIKDMKKHKTNNLKDYLISKQYLGKKTLKQIKTKLIDYLNNYIDSYLPQEIENRLQEWIEVNGTYYNHAYESPEVINFINQYVKILKNYIKREIENEKSEKIYLIYALDNGEIKKNINLKNLKHNLNITDENEFLDLNKKIIDILYYLINHISSEYREKSESLMKEYYQQFNR